jgi:hypothetical protein
MNLPVSHSVSKHLMLGLLKKDIKRIQRVVQKSAAIHLHRTTSFKVDVYTPQSTLLDQRSTYDNRGSPPICCFDCRYGDPCDKQ